MAALNKKRFSKQNFKEFHPSGSLGAQLKTVEDIMLTGKKIPFVNENFKMMDALKILSNKKLGILIVQDKKKNTKGIITDGQIRRFNQKNLNLQGIKVKKWVTKSF